MTIPLYIARIECPGDTNYCATFSYAERDSIVLEFVKFEWKTRPELGQFDASLPAADNINKYFDDSFSEYCEYYTIDLAADAFLSIPGAIAIDDSVLLTPQPQPK